MLELAALLNKANPLTAGMQFELEHFLRTIQQQPKYCGTLVYDGGHDWFWTDSLDAARWRVEFVKRQHPDAIGTIVGLRVKR